MFGRKQQAHPRGDDRERITQARQAAEALFAKPQSGTPSVSEVGPTTQRPHLGATLQRDGALRLEPIAEHAGHESVDANSIRRG